MSEPSYGRYQVVEPVGNMVNMHIHGPDSGTLKEVDWEPKCPVLDQSDLLAQGLHTSQFIPGCTEDANALGSCTANATMSALSNLDLNAFLNFVYGEPGYEELDAIAAEKAAIIFYNKCTDQTGQPGTEWPPTDCGSSGPYITQECVTLGLAGGDKIAQDLRDIISLLQNGGVLVGKPFLSAWESPDSNGFVDGDGTADTFTRMLASGIAGGHETFISAIEKLTIDDAGNVDPFNTILRERNSWSKSWGDNGSFRIHLSTYGFLSTYCDFRQLQPK